ncbi:hypothetical protein SpCBS45565_g04453 [Spizellomyces sp. 'palustris']|nr:hypothetical protein SpCBS45565_g04453 [Spizellomyces sp. 'palustris']
MKSFTIILTLFASVLAQAPCDMTGFTACKTSIDQFRTATCGPLQTGPRANATLYSYCLCYAAVNNVNCYNLCASSPNVTAERDGAALPQQTALCGAAGLNPAALPRPAPWDLSATTTVLPSATPTPISSAPSATGTSPPTSAQNNGAVNQNLMNVVAGAAAACLASVVALVL